MTLLRFVTRNRRSIDEVIRSACPNIGRLDDEERQDWVLNDEGLYNWAKSIGVEV